MNQPIVPRGLMFLPCVFLFVLPFPNTTALRTSALAATGALAAYVWIKGPRRPLPLKLPLFLWAAVVGLSLICAQKFAYSLGEVKTEIGYGVAAYASFFVLTRNEADFGKWVRAIVASLSVVAAMGVFLHWKEGGWLNEGKRYFPGVGSASTYLITVFPIVAYWALVRGIRAFPANLYFFLLPLIVFIGYLTLNRTFWLSLSAMIVVMGALLVARSGLPHKRKMMTALPLCMVAMTGVACAALVRSGAIATSSLTLDGIVSMVAVDARVPIWQFAINRIAENPWIGAGFGRLALEPTFREKFGLTHAHNILLDYAVQLGVMGVVVVVALFASLFRRYWMLLRESSALQIMGACGCALIVGLFVKNVTDDFFVRENALLFWSVVGMTLGYAEHLRWKTKQEPDLRSHIVLSPSHGTFG
jgi:O-antigen ligase